MMHSGMKASSGGTGHRGSVRRPVTTYAVPNGHALSVAALAWFLAAPCRYLEPSPPQMKPVGYGGKEIIFSFQLQWDPGTCS